MRVILFKKKSKVVILISSNFKKIENSSILIKNFFKLIFLLLRFNFLRNKTTLHENFAKITKMIKIRKNKTLVYLSSSNS